MRRALGRPGRSLLGLSLLGGLLVAVLVPSVPSVATAATRPATGSAAPQFTASVALSRDHLEGGQDDVVDSRNFSVSVSLTTQLRGHEAIDISWTGAHPTGGIVPDQNSGDAKNQEYPVVILECLGDNTAAAPVDPTGCWTATSGERFQDSFNTAFPPWRVDRYATGADRQAVAGQPVPRPAACFAPSPSEHWVPFRTSTGTVYAGGSGGCGGQAPEAANVGGLDLPSNTTYGVSRANGSGTATFDVWTKDENASLGCSDTVACSLVVVPIMGISCDVTAASLPGADQPPGDIAADTDSLCRAAGQYQPGQLVTSGIQPDQAVTGALWWAASNWRSRIVVPLGFATSSDVCDVVDNTAELAIYGSELMSQALAQWAPKFCLDSTLFRLKHVQTPEPQARNLLATGGVQAVFTSDLTDPASSASTVNAPVAVTGFAIAFTIDDAQGNPLPTLRLTPRLLAKLMTESYPSILAMKTEYPPLAANPLNITADPEFIALNPGVTNGVPASQSASALLALSSDSDVTQALTSYITNDPEARAWLDGAPDPWGMVVNPNYKGIALPVASWPLLDTFEPPLLYGSDTNDCLFHEPVPFLPLVAAPLSRLQSIALHMQFSLANSQTVCQTLGNGTSDGEKLVALGRQTNGFRFMLGVTSLADVDRYGLSAASLQTQVAPTAAAVITSADGRTFVAPTDDSLRAAAQLLAKDPSTNSWPIPYATMRTDPAGAGAYPGTMVVYAQFPSSGLSADDATHVYRFLRFAAGTGQEEGLANGQLPPGYLPLIAENHLDGLAAATVEAALAIAATAGISTDPPALAPATRLDPPDGAPPTDAAPADDDPSPPPAAPSPTPTTTRPSTRTTTPSTSVPVTVPSSPVVVATPAVTAPNGGTSITTPSEPSTEVTTVEPSASAPSPETSAVATTPIVEVASAIPPDIRVVAPAPAPTPQAPSGPTIGGTSSAGRTLPVLLAIGLLGLLGASIVNLTTRKRARA